MKQLVSNNKESYTIKDWCVFLKVDRTTLWRYIKIGYVPTPSVKVPRPRWDNAPSLAGFQSNENTNAS